MPEWQPDCMCKIQACRKKNLTLENLTGRFVLMKAFFSLRTVSFKNFSATLSKVAKLIFYVLDFVSWNSCFL